jgi:hypothetical protein
MVITIWRFVASDRPHNPLTGLFETPLPAENL